MDKKHILLIEDDPTMARLCEEYLRGEPYEIDHAATGQDGLDALSRRPPELVILDLKLPDMDGHDIMRQIVKARSPCAVVVITSEGSINTAVAAMKAGASEFLVKPFSRDRLIYTLKNTLERQELTGIVETIRENFDRNEYEGFIGASLPMQAVYRIIDSAAQSAATVFVTGESGTGKEICAEAIHHRSPRRAGPFIPVNCAAIPEELMESELFGHVKGAFTGAVSNRAGLASMADGGTLFLDEICEMGLNLQAKLLRFVQTSAFQKVGGDRIEKVDIRFVCASNRDPWAAVEAGTFREDLFYRLHVIPVHLPPLRERDEDVLALAEHFLTRCAAEEGRESREFTEDAREMIMSQYWPGNVRQLQNVIVNAVVLNDGPTVTGDMVARALSTGGKAAPDRRAQSATRVAAAAAAPYADAGMALRPMWQVERELINRAVTACGGNIPKAAALLELSPSTIYRRMKEESAEIVSSENP